jgi:hypothetical protein
MKKSILLLLVLFIASFAYALEVKQDSLDVAIIPEFNQPARIGLSITGAQPGNYNIYTLTAVKILPSDSFYLNSGTNQMTVDVYPTSELVAYGPTAYAFSFNLRGTDTATTDEGRMTVRVVGLSDAFSLSSDYNNPDSDKVSFYIKNRETIDLSKIHAKFTSIFFDVEQTFDIKANEKKEFSISVDKEKLKKIEAGSYLLKAEIQTDRGVKTLEGRILLGEKKGVVTKQESRGFFITTNDLTKTNNGNVVEQVSITVTKNIFNRLFTSFSIQPETVNRDGFRVTYVWNQKLMPADSFKITTRTNYLFPLLIILAIALLVIGFKRYTETKLEIEKSVVPVKTKNGQFALKIKLHLRAKKSAKNVSVVDRIPGIVQIYEKFGSNIKPSRIDVKNRRIQWDFGDLSAGEERIFSYMVYSTVGVVGKFSLPQTLAVFEKDGQIHEVESNEVYFLAEQRAPEL